MMLWKQKNHHSKSDKNLILESYFSLNQLIGIDKIKENLKEDIICMCDSVVGEDREGAGYVGHYFCGKTVLIYLLLMSELALTGNWNLSSQPLTTYLNYDK